MKLNRVNKIGSLNFLIGANLLLFITIHGLALLGGSADYSELSSALLIVFGALSGGLITVYGEYWRMVSSMFLHVDVLHILFNMLALYQLGMVIKYYYGGRLLMIFYVLSGLVGSLASIAFLPISVPTVGASGAVFGLLGVLLAGSLKKNRHGIDLPIDARQIVPILVYSLAYGFIPGTGVNNYAHVGGLITGIVLGWVFSHHVAGWKPRWKAQTEKVLYFFCLAILVVAGGLMLENVVNVLLN